MGAVYDIEGLLKFRSSQDIVDITRAFVTQSDDRIRFSDTEFDDLKGALECIFTKRGLRISNETDTSVKFYSGFDASYGWEVVMMDWFESVALVLDDGSELKIYPDSGVDDGVVSGGVVDWDAKEEIADEVNLQEAIDYINSWSLSEYGNVAIDDDTDLSEIPILYTTDGGDNEVEVQIMVDLIEPTMRYYINDDLRNTDHYEDLEDLIDSDLCCLDFNTLFSYAVTFARKSDYDPEYSQDYMDRRDD